MKCKFACTNHVCRDVRIRRHPNVTSHEGYILGALAVYGNATDAVSEFLTKEGSTIDQLGQITCDLGYGSNESDSWVAAAPGPSAKCSDEGVPFELAGCAECAAGKYSGGGASPCRDCQRGTYAADRRKDSCDACLPGHFQPHQAQTACQSARPGFYVPSARAAAERPCPEGEFNTQGGQSTCDRCYDDLGYGPAYTTSGPGATRCDRCRPQHFMDPTGRVCLSCDPDKMNCTLAGLSVRNLDILPGFFRMSPFVSDTARIKPCKYQAACTGGNVTGDASCDAGYRGPLCGVCRPDPYMNAQTFECMESSD